MNLDEKDLEVLNKIIDVFGACTKDTIVNSMHKEQAYIETAPNDIIQYKYAKGLFFINSYVSDLLINITIESNISSSSTLYPLFVAYLQYIL